MCAPRVQVDNNNDVNKGPCTDVEELWLEQKALSVSSDSDFEFVRSDNSRCLLALIFFVGGGFRSW